MHRSINQIVESIGRLARERGEIIDKLAGRGGTRTKNVHHFVKIPNPSGTRHYEWGASRLTRNTLAEIRTATMDSGLRKLISI